jgi:hypothetical protein
MDQDSAGQPANLAMLQQRFSQFEATFPATKISFEAPGQNGSGTQARFQVVLAAGGAGGQATPPEQAGGEALAEAPTASPAAP